MALAHRIIPVLLHNGAKLVKGRNFDAWRSIGHALQAAKVHQARGVDELVILDVGATPAGRGPDIAFVEELTRDCFMPVTYGGGVRTVEDVDALLRAGADKVAIGTAAFTTKLLSVCASRFGSQAIVAALDVKGNRVMIRCGTKSVAENWTPSEAARWLASEGAGEILLTAIHREGRMQGYDLPLIREVSYAVSVPVIANGGCSGPEDMKAAIAAGASACAAGSLFCFTDTTPMECARYLAEHGVEARV